MSSVWWSGYAAGFFTVPVLLVIIAFIYDVGGKQESEG